MHDWSDVQVFVGAEQRETVAIVGTEIKERQELVEEIASLLAYEPSLRESGQPSGAVDIVILCDDIEQQIQQQSHDRRPPLSPSQE